MSLPDTQTFINTIQSMRDPKQIEELCKHFGHVETSGVKPKSFANRLGAYTKLIKSIPQTELIIGQNAIDVDGKPIHLFMHFTGLAYIDWKNINQQADQRKIDDFVDRNPINVSKFFEVLEKLLTSSTDAELALGLIAASGRRPIEILYEAQFQEIDFAKIDAKDSVAYRNGYHIFFKNQVKKRDYDSDERVDYPIGLLVSVDYFLYAFRKFRNSDMGKGIREFALKMQNQGKTVEEIHNKIHDNIAKRVRRACEKTFNFINSIDVATRNETASPKDLRAVYIRLLMERDKPKKFSEIYFAGCHLGHIQNTGGKTKNLRNLANTVRYDQYYLEDGEVPMLQIEIPQAIKRIRGLEDEDKKALKQFQREQGISKQADAIGEAVRLGKIAADLQETVKKQQEELNELRQLKEKMIQLEAENELLKQKLGVKENSVHLSKLKLPKNPETMSNEELWQTRADGCSEVKLQRTLEAIKLYNDTLATGDEDTPRIAITNQLVRLISGVNPQVVGKYLSDHSDEIICHHCKYDLENKKDPTNLTTFYNKKLGAEKIEEITKAILSNFLKGVYIE